jgi:ferredoxin
VKVSVDADRCRGHGLCCIVCPDVFSLTEDGYSTVPVPEVPSEFEAAVREAAHVCPERAITVAE